MISVDLEGRVALVTGSSRGIGLSVAETLLDAGATVALNARSMTDYFQAAHNALCARHSGRVHVLLGDVSDPTQAKSLARSAFNIGRRLDILVNNAGILRDSLIGMISDAEIDDVLRTNLIGAIQLTQSAARLIARVSDGSIINIASIIGVRGNRGQIVYGASKAGLIGATLSAAKELAPLGVRVNAVAPGYVRTAMIENIPAEIHDQRMSSIGLGRIGEAQDVANLVLFLASTLSSYITGQVIGVDGGMTI